MKISVSALHEYWVNIWDWIWQVCNLKPNIHELWRRENLISMEFNKSFGVHLIQATFFETSGNKANHQKVTPYSNIRVGWIRINLFVSLHGIGSWLLDFAQTLAFIFIWRCWLRIFDHLFIRIIYSRPANHWDIFRSVTYQSHEMRECTPCNILIIFWYFSRFGQPRDFPRSLLKVFPNRR